MPNTLDRSNKKGKQKLRGESVTKTSPWDTAIAEARRRIADLRFSIRDFEKRKQRGDQWLGLE
jgi:hypothetical protein